MGKIEYSSVIDDNSDMALREELFSYPTGDKTVILVEGFREMNISQQRKMRILNKHLLLKDTERVGMFQLPKVLPYKGEIPEKFVPYNAKVSRRSEAEGVYTHIDDYRFGIIWNHPIAALNKIQKYMVAVAPDNTVWADGYVCENVEQLRRSRTIQRFWQNNGVRTIQTASWGNADSIRTYAFDGLAEESWTAVGHQRIGNLCEQRLFHYGIMTLVEKKKPLGLLVFGARLDFDPGVPVIYKPSFISKLRHL